MSSWGFTHSGLASLSWNIDVEAAYELQDERELGAFEEVELSADRVWTLSSGLAGRLDAEGRLRDAWRSDMPWAPSRPTRIRSVDASSLRSFPLDALPALARTEQEPALDTARRVLFRIRHQRELRWRGLRAVRYGRQAGTGVGRKLGDRLGNWERRAWQPHLVDVRLVLIQVDDMKLPGLGDRRGSRPGLMLSGRISDMSYTAIDATPRHDLVLVCEAVDGALFVHRGWAADMGGLVHGRRRYGLPLIPGDFFFEREFQRPWLVCGHGRPLLRCNRSDHGATLEPDDALASLGLDGLRIQAQRDIPAGTVDGPRSGRVEVVVPRVERKDVREEEGLRLAPEGAYRSTVWDYEGLDDGGLFGTKPSSAIALRAQVELPAFRWLT